MSDYDDMSIADLIDRYVKNREPHLASPGSLQSNAAVTSSFFGRYTLRDVCKPGALITLCRKYHDVHRNYAPGTVIKHLRVLQSSLRWAWKTQMIPSLPAMWFPGKPEPRQRRLSPHERKALLDAADAFPTEAHIRKFVYLALFTAQDMRKITDMRWDEVRLDEGVLVLRGRGKREPRIVQIDARLRKVLEQAYAARTCEYVIEWRGAKATNVYGGVKSLFERAGLEDFTLSDLRLSGAEEAAAAPAPSRRSLFISYCNADGASKAMALVDALETELGCSCWVAPRDVKAGRFPGQIARAINAASAFVVVLTEGANESHDVLQEVLKAHMAKKTIVPIIVDGTSPSEDLGYYLSVFQNIGWSNAGAVSRAILDKLACEGGVHGRFAA